MPRQSKDWCFTINNYTNDELRAVGSLHEEGSVIYIIYGKEVGDNQTPHLQGFLQLSRKKTLGGVKRLPGLERSHLEFRRGSVEEAIDYCKKDGDFTSFGSPNTRISGTKSSLAAACELIKQGKTMLEVAESHPTIFVQYRRGLFDLQQTLRGVKRTWKSHTTVFWGTRSGTGKSRLARDLAGYDEDPYIFMPSTSGCWFDGFHGQRVGIFDDFIGSHIPYRTLLQILDRYPCTVPIKGGSISWCPRKIYITSNINPVDWYSNEDPRPLMRRLDCIHHVEDALYDDIVLNNNDPLINFRI